MNSELIESENRFSFHLRILPEGNRVLNPIIKAILKKKSYNLI